MQRTYDLGELARALDYPVWRGSEAIEPAQLELSFSGVSTDTRSLREGMLFIALRGERFDAHDFLERAEGAAALVVDRPEALAGLPEETVALLVPDTMDALDAIARWYRRRFSAPLVAVAGSVGKTSTRDMVVAALGRARRVHATAANLNNHIGLAQTLLAAPEDAEVLVVELGIDQPGDMDRLGWIAEPEVALLTSIGLSHVAHFGDLDGILHEKSRLARHLRPGGKLLLNAADRALAAQDWAAVVGKPTEALPFSIGYVADAPTEHGLPQLRAVDVAGAAGGTRFAVERVTETGVERLLDDVRLAVAGRHHVRNALFALAVAEQLGVDLALAAASLVDFVVTGDRQRLIACGDVTVINDSYNASLESTRAALDLVDALAEGRRRVVVLGGIAELGSYATELHEAIGARLARSRPEVIFLSGPDAEAMRAGLVAHAPDWASHVQAFPDRETMTPALLEALEAGDLVLLKASRTYAYDRLADAIAAERTEQREER